VMGVWSNDELLNAGSCTDSLGQHWTGVGFNTADPNRPISWLFPPSGSQTAGITSVTCGTSFDSTESHLEFIEMSGVSRFRN
jgi:hypothetical protein